MDNPRSFQFPRGITEALENASSTTILTASRLNSIGTASSFYDHSYFRPQSASIVGKDGKTHRNVTKPRNAELFDLHNILAQFQRTNPTKNYMQKSSTPKNPLHDALRHNHPSLLAEVNGADMTEEEKFFKALKQVQLHNATAQYLITSSRTNFVQEFCWPVRFSNHPSMKRILAQHRRQFARTIMDPVQIGETSLQRYDAMTGKIKHFTTQISHQQIIWKEEFQLHPPVQCIDEFFRTPPTCLREQYQKYLFLLQDYTFPMKRKLPTTTPPTSITPATSSSSHHQYTKPHKPSLLQAPCDLLDTHSPTIKFLYHPDGPLQATSTSYATRVDHCEAANVASNWFTTTTDGEQLVASQLLELSMARQYEGMVDATIQLVFDFFEPFQSELLSTTNTAKKRKEVEALYASNELRRKRKRTMNGHDGSSGEMLSETEEDDEETAETAEKQEKTPEEQEETPDEQEETLIPSSSSTAATQQQQQQRLQAVKMKQDMLQLNYKPTATTNTTTTNTTAIQDQDKVKDQESMSTQKKKNARMVRKPHNYFLGAYREKQLVTELDRAENGQITWEHVLFAMQFHADQLMEQNKTQLKVAETLPPLPLTPSVMERVQHRLLGLYTENKVIGTTRSAPKIFQSQTLRTTSSSNTTGRDSSHSSSNSSSKK